MNAKNFGLPRLIVWYQMAIYNRTHGDGGASHSPSTQTLERLSAAQIKRFKDPVEHEKLSKAHIGYRHTEEAKLNMSLAQNKRFSDPAECKKISDATKGRNFSEQHCKNISFALKKYFNNPGSHKKMSEVALKRFEDPAEHEKLSKAHTGKKDTDETRAKKSAAQKKRWAKRRETAKKIANEMFIFLIMLVLAIQNDTPTLATGMDGLMSIVIADAARKSAEENRPVKISELMPKL